MRPGVACGTAGCGAELCELASELIKSIDGIEDTTADITEGGVGGTVRITTRGAARLQGIHRRTGGIEFQQ